MFSKKILGKLAFVVFAVHAYASIVFHLNNSFPGDTAWIVIDVAGLVLLVLLIIHFFKKREHFEKMVSLGAFVLLGTLFAIDTFYVNVASSFWLPSDIFVPLAFLYASYRLLK